jgi:hypothetical protein
MTDISINLKTISKYSVNKEGISGHCTLQMYQKFHTVVTLPLYLLLNTYNNVHYDGIKVKIELYNQHCSKV